MRSIEQNSRLPSKQTAHWWRIQESTGSALVQKQGRNSEFVPATNLNSFSPRTMQGRNYTTNSISNISFFSQWTAMNVKRTRNWHCVTAWSTRVGGSVCRHTSC